MASKEKKSQNFGLYTRTITFKKIYLFGRNDFFIENDANLESLRLKNGCNGKKRHFLSKFSAKRVKPNEGAQLQAYR